MGISRFAGRLSAKPDMGRDFVPVDVLREKADALPLVENPPIEEPAHDGAVEEDHAMRTTLLHEIARPVERTVPFDDSISHRH